MTRFLAGVDIGGASTKTGHRQVEGSSALSSGPSMIPACSPRLPARFAALAGLALCAGALAAGLVQPGLRPERR